MNPKARAWVPRSMASTCDNPLSVSHDKAIERALAFLFEHQLQEKYRYRHCWTEGDVLMWDNMGTIHNAVADYRPDEPRLIKRCQVMADKYFPELY